jgi:hypothetical protein
MNLYRRQRTDEHTEVWLGEATTLAARHAYVQVQRDQVKAAVLTLERGRAYVLSRPCDPLDQRRITGSFDPPVKMGQRDPGLVPPGMGPPEVRTPLIETASDSPGRRWMLRPLPYCSALHRSLATGPSGTNHPARTRLSRHCHFRNHHGRL